MKCEVNKDSKVVKVVSDLRVVGLVMGGVCTLALFVANIFFGAIHIPAEEVWHALWGSGQNTVYATIISESRLPQAVTALLCGASLAGAGLLLQTVFRNPLAGPSILGIDTGANLGVAVAMLALGSTFTAAGLTLSGFTLIIVSALAGAMMVLMVLLVFARTLKSPVMLLITGIMVSFIVSPVISLLNFWATDQGVHSFMVWGLGNFGGVSAERLPSYSILSCLGLVSALLMVKPLDAILLGQNYAQNLGINIRRTRTLLLLTAGWLTAISTAFCGPISFIGLAVPHLARMLTRTSTHRSLLPATLMMGASLALLCNLLSVLPGDVGIIPINVITPLIGAPVVIWVIVRS